MELNRESLQEIGLSAMRIAELDRGDPISSWTRAYIALSDAADKLDAMIARTEIKP